jgi:hypothetical protein
MVGPGISQQELPVMNWSHLVQSEQKTGQDEIFQTTGGVLVHLGHLPFGELPDWK